MNTQNKSVNRAVKTALIAITPATGLGLRY